MVSTRRTAHQEPQTDMTSDKDISGSLRKKPVRKATVRKAPEEAIPKTTRSTRNTRANEPVPAVEDEAPLPTQSEPATKPARRPVSRAKRQNPDSKSTIAPKTTTRATRARKAETTVNEDMQQAKPVSAATAKKQTRDAKAKAAPLSPKKVTQVSRPQTRNSRAVNLKPSVPKSNVVLLPPDSKASTRRRKVSDENAEISLPVAAAVGEGDREGEEEEEGYEAFGVRGEPAEPASTMMNATMEASAGEAEISMVSGPTTPPDSPRPEFDQLKDEGEYRQRGDRSTSIDGSDDEDEHCEASEDELCGPKTPMKRSSPSGGARYLASVQKTIHRANDEFPLRSPRDVRALFDNHDESSHNRIRCNEALVVLSSPSMVTAVYDDEGKPQARDPLSFVENCLEIRSLVDAHPESDGENGEPSDENASGYSADEVSKVAQEYQDDGNVANDEQIPFLTAAAMGPISEEDDWAEEPEQAERVGSDEDPNEDPNETIIVPDVENNTRQFSSIKQYSELLESEETVPIQHDIEDTELDVEAIAEQDRRSGLQDEGVPETLIWDNIRQDVTVDFDFGGELSDAWTLPQGEPTERLDIAASTQLFSGANGEQDDFEHGERDAHAESNESSSEQHPLEQVQVDTTLDLNDFVDVAALAEPTLAIAFPSDASRQLVSMQDVALEQSSWEMADVDMPSINAEDPADPLAVPHYALPTMASRRKSMPAIFHTPAKVDARPHTSDGASITRMARPFGEEWWTRPQAKDANATPVRSRPSTAFGIMSEKRSRTPARAPDVQVVTPDEHSHKFTTRQPQPQHAKIVAVPIRFSTPAHEVPRRPNTAQKRSSSSVTPRMSVLRPRRQSGAFNSVEEAIAVSPISSTSDPNTPTPTEVPGERFPLFQPKCNYEEHAKTVAAPKRFQTPSQTPARRPATVFRPSSLRKVALAGTTPPHVSHTPIKTPLKPPAMTPSQAPMTPHPAAPLRGVLALVEVFTLEGASASAPFLALLHRLGARTTRAWSERVTHVVFKDGSPTTLQRVRLHNKETENAAVATHVYCVNSRWVTDCDTEGKRMDESDEAYAVDLSEVPRGGKRRHKSMEPATLMNLNGNVVKERRSSLGRSSLGRSPTKYDSPAKKPEVTVENTSRTVEEEEKENDSDDGSPASPMTPAYLAAPDTLIQQTAPINRMRKLGLKAKDRANNRRLTFWNGGA